jgi:hypothetical protein
VRARVARDAEVWFSSPTNREDDVPEATAGCM